MEKISGIICNIPIDTTTNITNMLPRPADSNRLVIIKLKCKLEYHGHVLFETVRPVFLKNILNYLKINNHLYQDVVINTENISLDGSACTSYDNLDTSEQIHEVNSNCKSLSSEILNTPVIPIILQCGKTLEKAIENFEVISNFEDLAQHVNTPIPIILEPINELEETENLTEHSSSAAETCLVYTCPQINVNSECIDIAPGERKLSKSILNDE